MIKSLINRKLKILVYALVGMFLFINESNHIYANTSSSTTTEASNRSLANKKQDADKRNKENRKNREEEKGNKTRAEKEKEKLKDDTGTPSADSSAASNYSMGLDASVNPQNGQLTVNITNVKLGGIISDMDISLGICQGGSYINPQERFEDVPFPGWQFNLPYIMVDPSSTLPSPENLVVCMGPGKSFKIDTDSPTGLLYIKAGMHLSNNSNQTNLPTTVPSGYESYYQYKLTTYQGDSMYFDASGKFIAKSDMNNNYFFVKYENSDPNAGLYNNGPSEITDSLNQKISISYNLNLGAITVTLPDSRTAEYVFNGSTDTISIQNPNGTKESINYQFEPQIVTTVTYNGGGTDSFYYANNAVPYSFNGVTLFFPAVAQEVVNPNSLQGLTNQPEPSTTVNYNYTPLNSNNYTGYGSYNYTQSLDTLMMTGDNAYSYTTEITKTCDGNSSKEDMRYNFLHLLMEDTKYFNGQECWDKVTHYEGGGENDSFLAYEYESSNYSLPIDQTVTVFMNNQQASTTTLTTYNDFGLPLTITTYDNGINEGYTGQKTITYQNTSYDPISDSFIGNNLPLTDTTTYLSDETNPGKGFVTLNTTTTYAYYTNPLNQQPCGLQSVTTTQQIANQPTIVTSIQNYDQYGRVLSKTISDNASIGNDTITSNFAYSLVYPNMTLTTTDALGNSTTSTTDVRNDFLLSEVLKKSSSGSNSIGTTQTPENVNYSYQNYNVSDVITGTNISTNGLIVTKTYPDNSTQSVDSSDPNNVVTKDSTGVEQKGVYDGFGKILETFDNMTITGPVKDFWQPDVVYTYNQLGKVASKTSFVYDSASAYTLEPTTYTYNDWMEQTDSVTDYLGNIESEVYSVNGNCIYIEGYYNGIDLSTTMYNLANEKIGETNKLYGLDTMAHYNGAKQPVYSAVSYSGESNILTSATTDYDIFGKQYKLSLSTVDDPAGITTNYNRNLLGELVSSTTTYGTPLPPNVYDSGVHTLNSEIKTYDNVGNLITLENQLGHKQNFTYDQYGNLASKTDYAGNMFKFYYDNMFKEDSETINDKLYIKNTYFPGDEADCSAGKLSSVTLYADDGVTPKDQISYTYNPMGLLASQTMGGKTMESFYDLSGRLIQDQDYSGQITNYTYVEGTSNIATISNPKLGTVKFTYYSKDDSPFFGSGDTKKSETIENSSGTPIQTTTYTYYLPGDLSKLSSGSGSGIKNLRLKNMTTVSGSTSPVTTSSSYTYDNIGSIASIVQTETGNYVNSSGVTTVIPYNNPDFNNETDYAHNYEGQLTSVTVYNLDSNYNKNQEVSYTDYFYTIGGDVHEKDVTNYTYDTQGKQTTSTTKYIYAYNLIDQLKELITTPQGSGNSTIESFKYDKNGNMETILDSEGNVLQKFYFNNINQLVEYKDRRNGKPQYVYLYDYYASGLRKSKTIVPNPDYKNKI